MDKKIVVCGATGNQGGAVVEGLLKKQPWNVVVTFLSTTMVRL